MTNHGLSDQIHDDIKIKIGNLQLAVSKSMRKSQLENVFLESPSNRNSKYKVLQNDLKDVNFFYINGLKARSTKTIAIPVKLTDPSGYDGFYNTYTGDLTTNI